MDIFIKIMINSEKMLEKFLLDFINLNMEK